MRGQGMVAHHRDALLSVVMYAAADTRSFGCGSCSSCWVTCCLLLATVASGVESGHWTAEMRPNGVKRRIAFHGQAAPLQ